MSLDAFAVGDFDWGSEAGKIDAPEVAAILIERGRLEPAWTCEARIAGRCLVGAVDQVAAVAAEGGVLDFEGSGG